MAKKRAVLKPSRKKAPAAKPSRAMRKPAGQSRRRHNEEPARRTQPVRVIEEMDPEWDEAQLSGSDVDADWRRAHSVGEEAVSITVEAPDAAAVVDEIGEALGVPHEPDEEVRTSAEILTERDAERGRNEE